jgi:hypothetical protein
VFDLFFRKNTTLDASLLKAAQAGDAEKIETLLREGARPDARNPADARTAAHFAAKSGRLDILVILRRHKADLNLSDDNADIPLDMAIAAGHLDTVKGLFDMGVRAYNPELRNEYDPVYRAAHYGVAAVVALLHEKGCSIDKLISIYTKKRTFRVTPLHAAAMENRLDCMRTLLTLGADVNRGSVPSVFWAVRHRHLEAVEILLDAGCVVTPRVLSEAAGPPHSPDLVRRLETALRANPPGWFYRLRSFFER